MTNQRYDPIEVAHDCGPKVSLEGIPSLPAHVLAQLARGDDLDPYEEMTAATAMRIARDALRERKIEEYKKANVGRRSAWMTTTEDDEDEPQTPKRRRRTNAHGKSKPAGVSRTVKRRRTAARWRRSDV